MFGFIKRIFAGQPDLQPNPDPFARDPRPLPSAKPAVAESLPSRPLAMAILQRDEIIDARTRIAGYRFSARLPESPALADPEATIDILQATNVATFAERRLALISIRWEDWHVFDYTPLVGPNTAFLLRYPDDAQATGRWRETATMIRQSGARIALDGLRTQFDPALVRDNADYLLLDYASYSLPSFEQAVKSIKARLPGIELIVENIGRWAEQRYCLSLGIAHCLGAFTTSQDEEQQSGDIGQSRLILIEMLNHLRTDADLTDVAKVAKRDPGVVVKLVAMANSPALGLAQSVTSIDQAILVLGREQLYRWLTIALFRAGSGSPRDEVLLEISLARGRFLELIAQGRHPKSECDELFLLGLLSLLDSLLGIAMAQVIERINLSSAIREVLLNSAGPLGRYLMLAIAVEKGHPENVARLAGQLAIPLPEIEYASAAALAWAEEAGRLSQ